MSEQKFTQIENMLTELIHAVGTLKAYFEEEREENQRRFEQIDRRFEQMEARFNKRFDEMTAKLEDINRDQHYMRARIMQNEMDIQKVREDLLQQRYGK